MGQVDTKTESAVEVEIENAVEVETGGEVRAEREGPDQGVVAAEAGAVKEKVHG